MLVSAFTPSHNPTWLRDCWECLLAQTHTDWEWIVVANGAQADSVAETVWQLAAGDLRAVVLRSDLQGIGALKRFACDNAKGDIFLEYDHDDLLTDNCFAAVVEAAERCPPASFIFSDDVSCDHFNNPRLFTPDFGWEHYEWEYNGVTHKVNRQPDATARSICEILYAPDHVRAWTRAAYKLVGGHNPELPVGDDHDLMVRTYLKGVHFEHINTPLYIHRIDGVNTSDVRTGEIQNFSGQLRDRNLHALVAEWCRREKLTMLDMGGAHNCPRNFIPVDAHEAVLKHPKGIQANVLDAITSGLAYRDGRAVEPGTVGCIRCFDFLEHIPAPQVPVLMNWFYDLLAPGGWLLTHTPAVCDDEGRAGRGAWQDPTHVSGWSSNNFWYYVNKEFAKYVPEYRGRFQAVRLVNYYPNDWHRTHLIPYVDADLCKLVAGTYQPGPKYI